MTSSHRGGVGILFKIDDKFILERQYRYAFNEEVIEIPAGKLEEGEIPLPAAERELLEETGYRPLKMTFLGKMYPTVGYSNEEIEEMIKENKIKDSKTIAAIYWYKSKILKI